MDNVERLPFVFPLTIVNDSRLLPDCFHGVGCGGFNCILNIYIYISIKIIADELLILISLIPIHSYTRAIFYFKQYTFFFLYQFFLKRISLLE